MRGILEEQRKRIAAAVEEYRETQPGLFDQEEMRQLEADQRHWGRRLADIEQELRTRAGPHPQRLRRQGEAGRAGGFGLPVAGDGVRSNGEGPGIAGASAMARLLAAGRPRRLAAGAAASPGPRQRQRRRRASAVSRPCGRGADRRPSRARSRPSRICAACCSTCSAGEPATWSRPAIPAPPRWRSSCRSITRRCGRPTPFPKTSRTDNQPG